MKMTKICFYLTDAQLAALDKLSAVHASDVSKQLRRAVDEYITSRLEELPKK